MRPSIVIAATALLAACSGPKTDAEGRPITVGRLRLRTFPSGAKVWIDGALKVESTPATLLLDEGTYRLTIALPGAEALEKEIEIEAGEAQEIDLNIPKPPDATLTVLSDVVGAKVIVNGYTRGETPLIAAVTRPGAVDLTVTLPGGHAKSDRTVLGVGEQKRIELFFGPVACEVELEAGPELPISEPAAEGRITLGLEPNGEVRDESDRLLGETPLIGHALASGEHRLFLKSKDGRYSKWVTVEVEAGKTAIYRFRLREEDRDPSWRPSPDASAPD